jgi:molecular chaperone DnaK
MTKDAQSHADEDKNYREKVEAKNRLDNLVYSTEKMLGENRDKIPESDASSLDAAISKAKTTLEAAPDTAELKSAFDELTRASHRLAEVMYQKTTAQGAPGGGAGPTEGEPQPGKPKPEEEVIDAEYVDVDENKR